MANTIREQIILKIMTRLATLTVANGYNLGMGANVFRCRKSVDPASELPCVTLWPLVEESARDEYGNPRQTMPMRLEGLAAHGSTNPSVIVEKILGDFIKCMTATAAETTWTGGLTEDVFYRRGGTDEYPNEGDKVTAAFAEFDIIYTTDLGDPYSQ